MRAVVELGSCAASEVEASAVVPNRSRASAFGRVERLDHINLDKVLWMMYEKCTRGDCWNGLGVYSQGPAGGIRRQRCLAESFQGGVMGSASEGGWKRVKEEDLLDCV